MENELPEIDYSSFSNEEIQVLIKNKILNRILSNPKESSQLFLIAKNIFFDSVQSDKNESDLPSDEELLKAAQLFISTKKKIS